MSIKVGIDLEVGLKQYKLRLEQNKGKQLNNASLPAGSPMYFYCKFCGCPTDTLPENYLCTPKQSCEPCELLHAHGLV